MVIAALKRLAASGAIKRDELAVAFITGSGLKTLEVVARVVRPVTIKPTLASFQEALGERLEGQEASRGR